MFGCQRVIAGRGRRPGACLGQQSLQKRCRVPRIGGRIERIVQCWEGSAVVQEIDLHAPHVDRAYAAGLQRQHGGDRLALCCKIRTGTFGIDRPRPGDHAARLIPPPALHRANGVHQPGRHARAHLCRSDRGLALLAGPYIQKSGAGRVPCAPEYQGQYDPHGRTVAAAGL